MSTLLHPVGSRPPGTYWVRRALVLVVVLALVVGIRQLFFSGGSSSTATPEPSGSTSSAPDPSESASTTGSASPKPSSSTSSGIGPCKNNQLQVTSSTDAASYQVGATPQLRMRIKNISKTACTRDVGSKNNELVITSGNARVWSSDDCNTGGSAQVVTLEPAQSYSVNVTWLGRLSQKGCPPDQPIAEAGTYKLVGRNGEVSSDAAVFSLTGSG